MSFNRATLIGNLGDDPALQVHPTGQAEISFWVGTDEAFRGEIRQRLEWHRVVALGKLAETCCQHLRKGGLVYVEGELRSHESEGADDQSRHQCTVILASRVRSLGATPNGVFAAAGI
jgi:single-strand DNA-binding protein